jgi:tetratricopeptide (TPR) repeat protein
VAGRRDLILLAIVLFLIGIAAADLSSNPPSGALNGLPAKQPTGALSLTGSRSTPSPDLPGAGDFTPDARAGQDRARLNEEGLALYATGQLSEALAKFAQAMAQDDANGPARRNLAFTKAQLAWRHLEAGERGEALRTFEEADGIQPGEAGILLGLGVTNHALGRDAQARALLHRALDVDANQVIAHKLLGELAYRGDDLSEAAARFETALRLDPSDSAVRERLERVRHEAQTRGAFQKLEGRHFTVKFEDRRNTELARDVLGKLEAAHQDLERWLGRFPHEKVPVILHHEPEFRDDAVAPAWAQGGFDGRIRIPLGGAFRQGTGLQAVIRHESMHALVHARTRGHVPTWLTEGLAIAFEGRDTQGERDLLRRAGHAIPLTELHGSFLTLSPSQVSLAYAESFAAVEYLLNRHGVQAVRSLLERLGDSKDFARAFQEAVGLSYDDFQAALMRSLIDPGGSAS